MGICPCQWGADTSHSLLTVLGPIRRPGLRQPPPGTLVMRASGVCNNLCRAGSVELTFPLATDAPGPAPTKRQEGNHSSRFLQTMSLP
jgi:hypothetical protein